MRLLAFAMMLAGAAVAGSALAEETPPVAAAPVADSTFAEGEGQPQVAAACAACHPAMIITGKRFSEEKWAEVVDQMIDKGAVVSDADYDVIVAYLARTYGEAKGG